MESHTRRARSSCVMVVEDEYDIQEVLHEFLSDAGYRVVGSMQPSRVLRTAQEEHPDLFLIDIMMPHASGFEVARELREDGFEDAPILAMSASVVLAQFARESGLFHATYQKPLDIDVLLSQIDDLLRVKPTA